MKVALLIVLSLSALAYAGPAFNKNNNQVETQKAQQYMTSGDLKQTQATETLKQWCFSSQMSQPELTASFKKLVGIVKSSPEDQSTEAAVMSERLCQGAQKQQQQQGNQQQQADAQAHELIKDVYMDALIACESQLCMQQLVKIVNSNQVDTIRASYYMTRIAVAEKDSIKDDNQVEQFAKQFIATSQHGQSNSEAIERQKLFATTSLIGKSLMNKSERKQSTEQLKQTAEQVAKTIVERYIKPVSQQEVQEYQQQQPEQQSQQVAKKIAKRNAALKALANIPGWVLSEVESVEQTLIEMAQNKQEQSTARQSAIECLEQNEDATKTLKQITFDQDEPIEVRIAAYRALMTSVYAAGQNKDEQTKHQQASEIVDQVVRHCEEPRNQQQDDQFVLYVISHLDNLRTSQQPEHQTIKECIAKNKQSYMQIQILNKKFKQQLSNIRKSSRNYKLEQEFNQIESGLIVEGDIIYESKQQQNKQQQQQLNVLPKLIRVNMSMPVMGETVNVVEITLRQDQMDEEILGALKLVQGAKFNTDSLTKVVDSFKSSVEQQQQQQRQQQQNKQQYKNQQQQDEDDKSAEADLTIKVDGCTIIYLSVDDFKSSSQHGHHHQQQQQNRRNTRSTTSLVDEIIEHLKRKPVAFNRGFNFNIQERIAKVLDVEANIIAGLRFESRAQGESSEDYEIVAQVEPRFGFEAIVGPAKMSNKKLLQRVSTKTALGLRLRYKSDELVDVQVDLPMNTMELFTVQTQMIEKNQQQQQHYQSYTFLPESIYGQADIYDSEDQYDDERYDNYSERTTTGQFAKGIRKMKRSIFEKKSESTIKSIFKFMQGKQSTFVESFETPEEYARATGLRTKVRFVASPKDMSFLAQAVAQKYEPSMQGYRFQIQKVSRGNNNQQEQNKQYIVSVSTPGSSVDRTMQVRIVKQENAQRTIVKSEIQSPKMTASAQYELVHDGRQYAVKAEIVGATRGKQQFRHQIDCGVQRNSQSGRVSATYKPYVNIDSSSLKRPVQMQGVVSYQQSPKTVISYELKSSSSSDFVQGKIILDDSSSNTVSNNYKRTQRAQRSMQSQVEQLLSKNLLQKDLTLTSEFVGQIEEHAFKVHKMLDWDSDKMAIQADWTVSHKNLRKSNEESQVSANLKLDKDQQMITIQRKNPQQERKEYRLTVVSDTRSPNSHQLTTELRYNGKRQSVVAYKHKLDYTQKSAKKCELGFTVEVVDSERKINERFTGRTQVDFERKMKSIETEMSARGKSAKLDMEYVSLDEHKFEIVYQGERVQHKTLVRADQRQFVAQSRTEKDNKMVCKVVAEVAKQQVEGQLIVEVPQENLHLVAQLKVDKDQQMITIQRKNPQQERKEYRLTVVSDTRSPNSHQLTTELRYNGKRQSVVAYKHKLDYTQKSAKKCELGFTVEFVHSERKINEKFSGRTQVAFERKIKSIETEMSARGKSAKLDLEYVSLDEHKCEIVYQGERLQHRTLVRADQRQYSVQSRTEKDGQMQGKIVLEISKDQEEGQLIIELPTKRTHIVADLKLAPGKLSSIAVQTPRYSSKGEFSFEKMARSSMFSGLTAGQNKLSSFAGLSQFRFKSDLKDAMNKEAYWMESAWNSSPEVKSYLRLDSPIYRGDVEFEPREQKTKFGLFARSKRSTDSYNKLYSSEDSSLLEQALEQASSKLSLGNNKLWMIRSVLNAAASRNSQSTPATVEQLKQKALRALFEYADRRQSQKHSFEYEPSEERVNFNFERQPNTEFQTTTGYQYQPMRLTGDLSTRRPSTVSMESEWIDFDLDTKPFDIEEPYAKLSALSRHPRSAFKKHESEIRYNKQHGYKAWMQHQDSKDKRHSMQMEADQSPKKYAKMSYDSDKYGKGEYEHQWRKTVNKRSHQKRDEQDQEDVYSNKIHFQSQSPKENDWTHRSTLQWEEPTRMVIGGRVRRDVTGMNRRDYLTARFLSQTTGKNQAEKFNVDFDYQPESHARLNIRMPEDMYHESEVAFAPKGLYKLSSKYMNRRTNEPSYEISASGKKSSFGGLISGEQDQYSSDDKIYFKINGKRTNGQLVLDLASGIAQLNLDVDNKRTVQHETRVVRENGGKYYSVDSMTNYKQQPLLKLLAKVSSMILEEPMHLLYGNQQWQQKQQGQQQQQHWGLKSQQQHMSTFDAIVYGPKPMQVSGQFDCTRKLANLTVKDLQ